jgi:DnaK suppressor protein
MARENSLLGKNGENTMNKVERERYREQLEKLKSRMRADATAVAEQARSATSGQASGELSNAPMHLGDSGTEEFLHDLNATLVENEEYLANEVREALRRIEKGTFGRCESCGKAIAKPRLDAMPYARLCVACAETDERAPEVNLDAGRPRSPADTLAPEGEMEEDRLVEGTSPAETLPGTTMGEDTIGEDTHAAGAPGGGTAIGGLAGSNIGTGDPKVSTLEEGAGSGDVDAAEERIDKGAAGRPVIPVEDEEVPRQRAKKASTKSISSKPPKKSARARK